MNIEIANRLVQMRKAHGLSQEELAARLGISRQAVSKWERAESSPDTDNLIMLSRLYGVSLDQLLATEDEIPRPEAEPEEEAEKAARQGVHFSFHEGINVTDDDGSRVHIGWDGIHVNDGSTGERVDIGGGGKQFINDHINDIETDAGGVSFTENGERVYREWNSTSMNGKRRYVHKHRDEKTGKYRTTIVDEDGKRVVLDTDSEPNIDQYGNVRSGGDAGGFPYAILVTGVFLLLGFLKNWWHPAWILFLTIPIYYPIASAIRRRSLSWLDIAIPILVTGGYVALGSIYNLWHPLWIMLLLIPAYYALSFAVSGVRRSGSAAGIWAVLAAAAYVAIGFAFGKTGWKVGWLLFLTVPMVHSIAGSIDRRVGIKWLARFPWEILITGLYLFVGLMYGIWHPTWIAFLLIPVLRWAISAIVGNGRDKEEAEFDADDDDE